MEDMEAGSKNVLSGAKDVEAIARNLSRITRQFTV